MNSCFSVYTVLLGCLLWSQDVSSKRHGHLVKASSNGKIVGGHNTTIQDYPYQVYLLLKKGNDYYQCGGSIITDEFVLTAAHCLNGIERVYIRAGTTQSNSGGKVYKSSDLRIHPKYRSKTSDFDVGLIKTPEKIDLNDKTMKAVMLTRLSKPATPGENITVTGWGTTSENGQTSTNLMSVEVPVISRDQCNEDYKGSITERMFCAGEAGKDSCQGDSGGPAVDKDHVQKGIVSFGVGCARDGYPGVYTDLTNRNIRLWLDMNTGKDL